MKSKLPLRIYPVFSPPVVREAVAGSLVQSSPLAVMLRLYDWPQCRSARVQLFTEVLQMLTCPSLPVAVSRYDVATGEEDHVTVAPFCSQNGSAVTPSGAQGAEEDTEQKVPLV